MGAVPIPWERKEKCRILDLGTMVADATRLASVFCRFTRRRSRFHAQLLQGADPYEEVKRMDGASEVSQLRSNDGLLSSSNEGPRQGYGSVVQC